MPNPIPNLGFQPSPQLPRGCHLALQLQPASTWKIAKPWITPITSNIPQPPCYISVGDTPPRVNRLTSTTLRFREAIILNPFIHQYRSPGVLAILTMASLAVLGVILIVSVFYYYAEIGFVYQLRAGASVTQADATGMVRTRSLINLIYLAAWVTTALFFSLWTYRVSKNLLPLDYHDQRFSPGWSVGWWFIPALNLFRPYQVVREIWQGSFPNTEADRQPAPLIPPTSPLLGWWWAAWLIGLWGTEAVIHLYIRPTPLEVLMQAGWPIPTGPALDQLLWAKVVYLVSDLAMSASGVLAAILVFQITAQQQKKHAALILQTPQ